MRREIVIVRRPPKSAVHSETRFNPQLNNSVQTARQDVRYRGRIPQTRVGHTVAGRMSGGLSMSTPRPITLKRLEQVQATENMPPEFQTDI